MARRTPQGDPRSPERPTHHVVMVGFDDAQILDITGPLEVFARTSRWLVEHRGLDRNAYRIELVGERPGPFRTSGGLLLHAERGFADVEAADTLIVAGGIGYRPLLDQPQFLGWLARTAGRSERLVSICTGSLLLAAAGLLDSRRATTHWAYTGELQRLARSATVEEDAIFVRDGRVLTSAGVTAGMDLALALVEEDWGRTVALSVAQELVLFLKRPGGQSQFSRLLEAQQRDDRFGALESWILDHLGDDLSVPVLARQMGMSVRQLSRRFADELRTSPARLVEQLRIEGARRRMSDGHVNLKAVARDCGFGDVQRMRRAFRRHLGITPAEYQARFC